MKSTLILLTAGLFYGTAAATIIPLEDALQTGKVQVHIQGRFDEETSSGHTGKCATFKVTNLVQQPLKVQIEAGRILVSIDEHVQDLVVTEDAVLALSPLGSHTYYVYAMCGQIDNGGPGDEDVFTLGKMAPAATTRMASYLWEKNYQNETGQSAMWVCTDGMPISSIEGENPQIVADLQRFATEVLGISMDDEDISIQSPPPVTTTVSGTITTSVVHAGNATLELINPENSVEHTLFSNVPLRPGRHTFSWEVNGIAVHRPGYRVVLTINGRNAGEAPINY